MQSQLLFSELFALQECASLQPNSRSWHNEKGIAPQVGMSATMGYLLDAGLRDVMGELRPVDGPAMQPTAMAGICGLGIATELGKRRLAQMGGIMRHAVRPIAKQTQIGDYITGASGTTGTFKKINTGSHSRLGGLPPHSKASAPPGRAGADPGGGPTAS